jgi:hypothetical protein
MARENGSGSFRKLPNGSYEYAVTIGFDEYGRQLRKRFYGRTKSKCHEKHEAFLRGDDPNNTLTSSEYTLSGWLDYWLKTYKKQNLQSASYDDYVGLANHVKQHRIGNMELTQVKQMHIMEYFAEKTDYSQSFRKRSKFLLNSAYEHAVNNDICSKNPVRGADIGKKPQVKKEAFSEDEVKTILEFAKTDKWFGLPMYIMLNSGIRSQDG